MKIKLLAALLLAACAGQGVGEARTLREIYELAGPGAGYDKYIELECGEIYTGGLLIGPSLLPYSDHFVGDAGLDVRIVGNGAILDLQGQQLCISYCQNRLDIDDCIVTGGNIRFRGVHWGDLEQIPTGSVRQVTFYRSDDYGIRLQGAGGDITLERNLLVDALDTGWDFIYMTGIAAEQLPTGTNISGSVQVGFYGWPSIRENWSYRNDEQENMDPLAHFSFL